MANVLLVCVSAGRMAAPRYRSISAIDNRVTVVTCRTSAGSGRVPRRVWWTAKVRPYSGGADYFPPPSHRHVRQGCEPAVDIRLETVRRSRWPAELYGPSLRDSFARLAFYVDKILKGSEPSDLPVEQPNKLELILNNRTAKQIGITLPASLFFRADEVIE